MRSRSSAAIGIALALTGCGSSVSVFTVTTARPRPAGLLVQAVVVVNNAKPYDVLARFDGKVSLPDGGTVPFEWRGHIVPADATSTVIVPCDALSSISTADDGSIPFEIAGKVNLMATRTHQEDLLFEHAGRFDEIAIDRCGWPEPGESALPAYVPP